MFGIFETPIKKFKRLLYTIWHDLGNGWLTNCYGVKDGHLYKSKNNIKKMVKIH